MPAAIDRLEIDTLPDGLGLSPEMAVVANVATNKNKTNLEIFVIFDTDFLLFCSDPNKKFSSPSAELPISRR
jgi:hypothetical protein